MKSSYVRIRPFKGLVPAGHVADRVNCVPYDVISTEEARVLVEGNPYSLLHVDRAEVDLPRDIDPHDERVYQKAAENFQQMRKDGALVREKSPRFYLYRQAMGEHHQEGLVATCHIDDYLHDVIRKHEKTRKDKEDDRTKLIDTIDAQTGPIFMVYRDIAKVSELSHEVKLHPHVFDYTAEDGVRHTLWRVPHPEKWVRAFQHVPVAYIADGHHRAASAARVAQLRRTNNPNHTGHENYYWFLSVLFPASQVKILPYNRCVKDLNGLSLEVFLSTVGDIFGLEENMSPEPDSTGQIRMYVGRKWYGLKCPTVTDSNPVAHLDVSILQDRLLSPILDIDDPRTNPRIDFIGGARGVVELERKVNSGEAAVAFSMHPTTVEQMMEIADAGQMMPPKSTWFEPKLRSGFFIHTLEGSLNL